MTQEWWLGLTCFAFVCAYLWQAFGFVDRGIKFEQGQVDSGQDFDPQHVRLATVHMRQDVIGLYYLLFGVVQCLGVIAALLAVHIYPSLVVVASTPPWCLAAAKV